MKVWLCTIVSSLMSLCINAQYNVERLIHSGQVALHYEDYVLSIQYFNQAINQKPFLWEPWQLRAISKYYLEDWQGTENDAAKAIELNPYITSLYDLHGIACVKQKLYKQAIDDYSKAIELDPNNKGYWYNRVVCYMEDKQTDIALQQIDTITKRWSNYAPTYFIKADIYLQEKDTAEAVKCIDKGLAIDPHNAEAWRMKAYVAFSQSKCKEAETCFSKTLHYTPKDTKCLINRALTRLRLNNLRGAMEDYDMAIELSPNNFIAHYNRGLLRQQVGDDNRAIEDFDYVLSMEPGNVMALFNRAVLLDRTGNLRGAIRDYSHVINKFPNFWIGLKYRAECYRKLGMIAKAEKDEFRILKAQMDKHLGIQNRWSKNKSEKMRRLSDIDPEKYDQLVVDDQNNIEHEYKSEYRGKVQNRASSEFYQPYIALTIEAAKTGLTSYTPFDPTIEKYIESLKNMNAGSANAMPVLGGIGEGTGISTFALEDSITSALSEDIHHTDSIILLVFRSIAYSSAQNYTDALKDINAVLDMDPDNIVAIWQKSICLSMMTEYEQSKTSSADGKIRMAAVKDCFDKLSHLSRDNAILLYNEGTFYARNGNYTKAINSLTKSIAIDSQLPYAYYNRAIAYMRLNETAKAKADLSKAGELGLYNAYSLMKAKK